VAGRNGRRRSLVAATSVLGAGLILSASGAGVGARPVVVLEQAASIPPPAPATTLGNGLGSHSSVSGDGRIVAYQGSPSASDDSRLTTAFVTDREDGTTTEITPVPEGVRPGDTIHPVVSGDGCTVVVVTELQLDVFRDDDTGDRWDVYRSSLPHCTGSTDGWELISTDPDGGSLARDDVSVDDPPAVSRNGTVVAYTHPATHLFDGEEIAAITVVDLSLPTNDDRRAVLAAGTPISTPDTQFVHRGLDQPALSGDGRYLAMRSDALSADAVAGWGTGQVPGGPATSQVFVWDREEPDPFLAVRLVSARPDGEPSAVGASEPVLSRDGSVVAFTSADPGLVPAVFPPCPEGCPSQVYRLDRDADDNGWLDEAGRTRLSLVSSEPGIEPAVAGLAPSFAPALNADGQLVAFITKAPNLQLIKASGGGEATDGDLLIADARSGGLRRVAMASDGVRPALAAHARPGLSDTGRTTVFETLAASQIVPGSAAGRQVVAVTTEPSLSLPDADLGTTLVGLQSDEWYVAVINNGPTSFVPSLVTVSDGRFSVNEETSTCTFGASVPPGGDCTVLLTFNPTTPGPVDAELTVAEQGFEALAVTSRVSGAGGDPTLRTNPAGADLGLVDIGQTSSEFVFDVENISPVLPTSIASIIVAGTNASDFAISGDSCINRPLNPRSTCSVSVTFSPTAPGRRVALVEIATETGQYTAMVAAGDARYAPELTLLVDEIEAGGAYVAGGTGYPANTELSVVFADGSGERVTVVTDAEGGFLVEVPVAPGERGGERQIVVQSPDGTAASTAVEVIEQDGAMIGMPGFGLGG